MFYILKEKDSYKVRHYRNDYKNLMADCEYNNISINAYDLIESDKEPRLGYDGNLYLADCVPEIPLDDIKSKKRNEINQAREQARIDEGAEYDNDLFDIDEKSQANITAIVSMLMANNVPDTYKSVYRSKTNNNHELTKLQMVELGTVIGAKVTEIYQKSWTLKEQVNNATTREEIEVIKWNM